MLNDKLQRAPFRIFGPEGEEKDEPVLSLAPYAQPHPKSEAPGARPVAAPAPVSAPGPETPKAREPEQQQPDQPATRARRVRTRGKGRKKALLGAAALTALGLAGYYGHHWYTVGQYIVSTDDAYVSAHNTTLAAKFAGYIAEVAVDDNSVVRAGDVVARLDDGDFRLAVEAARNKVATQAATIASLGQQITAQQANVAQAQAQVAAAEAAQRRAELEFDRQETLVQKTYASQQTLDNARAARDQADADVASAAAAVDAAKAQVGVLEGQREEAQRTLAELKTAQAQAERDLSFTVIRAPIDGVVGNRAMQVGDYVTTGTRLASIVPLDKVYIDANFKETQVAELKPGQPVEISVDALPEHDVIGTVESVAPASGAVFSLLPPDNATGNFTKIVQRMPVRISVPADVLASHALRPGMSVVVEVNTKGGGPSDDRVAAAEVPPAR